jgi:hypothetical protein
MNKQSSDKLKEEITKYCRKNEIYVRKEFDPPLTYSQFEKTMVIKNWKRMSKCKVEGNIERCFDCFPFDDQLRATVITDSTDTNILSLTVQGE